MKFKYTTLETCHTATGMVVVIDVIRAFTTAAYAFAAGAENIFLVSTVEEALTLRDNIPNSLIMGEVKGLPVESFDFNNSPSQLVGRDFRNFQIIQRTSAGVQGVIRSTQADTLLVGSFVCANATLQYIRQQAPPTVTFVITGLIYTRDGEEDTACADYLKACLQSKKPDPTPFIERVNKSTAGQLFTDPASTIYPPSDLERCTQVDHFDFAMQAKRRKDGLLVLNKVAN